MSRKLLSCIMIIMNHASYVRYIQVSYHDHIILSCCMTWNHCHPHLLLLLAAPPYPAFRSPHRIRRWVCLALQAFTHHLFLGSHNWSPTPVYVSLCKLYVSLGSYDLCECNDHSYLFIGFYGFLLISCFIREHKLIHTPVASRDTELGSGTEPNRVMKIESNGLWNPSKHEPTPAEAANMNRSKCVWSLPTSKSMWWGPCSSVASNIRMGGNYWGNWMKEWNLKFQCSIRNRTKVWFYSIWTESIRIEIRFH